MTVGLLQCDPITLLKSLSWKSRLNVCSSSSGEGSERNVEPWPPCCWLSPVEPKWPLTQSPLLESTATLDLQEKFSFEDLSSWLPSSPARSPSPAVPLRVVPTLSTTDMKTADKIELGDSDLKLMLKKHHEKRKHQPDHPDLLTGDLTLSDIMTRVNAGRKGSLAALYDLAVLKKKVKEKEEKKKKKIKLIKSEAEDLAEPLSNTEGVPTLSQAPSPLAISSIKEE